MQLAKADAEVHRLREALRERAAGTGDVYEGLVSRSSLAYCPDARRARPALVPQAAVRANSQRAQLAEAERRVAAAELQSARALAAAAAVGQNARSILDTR